MTDDPKDEFPKEEARERFEKALRGGLSTPPKPLKSMTPKRKTTQQAKKK